MIRVGPSQGTISGLDLGVPKEFDKESQKDFIKELKLAKDKDSKELDAKAERQEKPNRDTNAVSEKSSRGMKKKMAQARDEEPDAKKTKRDVTAEAKISKVMDSNESEVEIADFTNEENLPLFTTDNIPNIQAQLLAAQTAVTGKEVSQSEQGVEPVVQDVTQPMFQHMTRAEENLLADINGTAPLQAMTEMPIEGSDIATETPKLQLQAIKDQSALTLSLPQQDALAKDESKASALESKAFEILNKETAATVGVGQKIAQQEASQSFEQNGNNQKDQSETNKESHPQELRKFEASNDLAAQVSALHTGQRSFQSHLGAATATEVAVKPELKTDAMKDENVREIMNQAKFLVTQGGGEMTVRMTPEGMGEVQLKVALENGKINIEMNSQDKSVKKLLEENLSDLKSSLAGHQMRVEHVKINNVTAIENTAGANNQSQFQSDANSSNSSFQNRQQQEMNFQNMANSNSGRNRQQQERASSSYQTVQTPSVKLAAKANAYIAGNKGSSINMVA